MRKIHLLYILVFSIFFFSCQQKVEKEQRMLPEGFFDYEAFENDQDAKNKKKVYKEERYYADEHTNVDSIRYAHQLQHHQQETLRMTTNAQSLPSVIAGDWFERGPSNEAGDVRRVDYDPDSLYVMSVAGHI